MKTQRLLIVGFVGVALAVLVLLVASSKPGPALNAPKLVSAVQAFARDQVKNDRELPAEVSVSDLVRGGYLTPKDTLTLKSVEFFFNTNPDLSNPHVILAHAQTSDRQHLCLLADGSVQQFKEVNFRAALQKSRQTDGSEPR